MSLLRSLKIALRALYAKDGLATSHVPTFLDSHRFRASYAAGKATNSWGAQDLEWRIHSACWAAQRALTLRGDFVECGVNLGGLSRAVIEYTNFARQSNRKFYLLDTFHGFVERDLEPASKANRREYGECFELVKKTFAQYSNVVLVRGDVVETLPTLEINAVAFLSIDMNSSVPEIAAMHYFWERLVPGAIVLLDDYAYSPAYENQRRAFDQFASEKKTEILCLSTGQGLIIR
jgi:O-methyltransferase